MADLKASKVNTDDDILAQDHNDIVDDLSALNDERPLKGDPGDQGDPGEKGDNGKSAFEIAQDNGFEGTEQEWLESLKGEPGNPGKNAENQFTEEQKNALLALIQDDSGNASE